MGWWSIPPRARSRDKVIIVAAYITLNRPVRLLAPHARYSSAKGDPHHGDYSNHGESVAAKPDRDHCNKLDAGVDVILNHHLQTKRGMMK